MPDLVGRRRRLPLGAEEVPERGPGARLRARSGGAGRHLPMRADGADAGVGARACLLAKEHHQAKNCNCPMP
jgi:hypothetical protein